MPTTGLIGELADKEFRHAYVDAQLRELLALQIRLLRENRDWTQAELGERAGMAQERISLLEDPDYRSITVKTLKRLAEAFDVALIVRLAPFTELLRWAQHMSPEQLVAPDFEHDAGMQSFRAQEVATIYGEPEGESSWILGQPERIEGTWRIEEEATSSGPIMAGYYREVGYGR